MQGTELNSYSRMAAGDVLQKASLCSGVLCEARRLVTGRIFGPLLSQLLCRASDLLDEIDETLLGLHAGRDVEAFLRVAALHRELAEILSLLPREYRALPRRA